MKNRILTVIISLLLLFAFAFSSSAFTLGDGNGDGKVSVADARLALRCVAKLIRINDIKNLDIDGNGKISVSDARSILRVSAKLDTFTVYGEFAYSYVPEYSGKPYAEINGNKPYFTKSECVVNTYYEYYSPLDSLGRCGYAESCIGKETMPTTERGNISSVKPTGWINNEYSIVDGGRIYNRCHLIGWQLTAENANKQNLITGTRSMNTDGMLPFENETDDYIDRTKNHVLYRVTPVFVGDELVCRGVLMEAFSLEDNGRGVSFCVFCYNVQDGITIDYKTGDNHLNGENNSESKNVQPEVQTYILNTNTKKFHLPTCSSVQDIKEKNKAESSQTKDELCAQGYSPCKICKP